MRLGNRGRINPQYKHCHFFQQINLAHYAFKTSLSLRFIFKSNSYYARVYSHLHQTYTNVFPRYFGLLCCANHETCNAIFSKFIFQIQNSFPSNSKSISSKRALNIYECKQILNIITKHSFLISISFFP
jgi:hypothetical protein